jgi:uncharacterized protein YxjI
MGEDVYEVKSNLSMLHRLTIYDMNKKPLIKIKKRYFRVFPRFDVCSVNNDLILAVKAKFSFLTKKCKIKSYDSNFNNIIIEGNILAWSFYIKQGDEVLVELSKKVFKIADSYCITINDEKNALLYLAMIIILDCIYHKKR